MPPKPKKENKTTTSPKSQPPTPPFTSPNTTLTATAPILSIQVPIHNIQEVRAMIHDIEEELASLTNQTSSAKENIFTANDADRLENFINNILYLVNHPTASTEGRIKNILNEVKKVLENISNEDALNLSIAKKILEAYRDQLTHIDTDNPFLIANNLPQRNNTQNWAYGLYKEHTKNLGIGLPKNMLPKYQQEQAFFQSVQDAERTYLNRYYEKKTEESKAASEQQAKASFNHFQHILQSYKKANQAGYKQVLNNFITLIKPGGKLPTLEEVLHVNESYTIVKNALEEFTNDALSDIGFEQIKQTYENIVDQEVSDLHAFEEVYIPFVINYAKTIQNNEDLFISYYYNIILPLQSIVNNNLSKYSRPRKGIWQPSDQTEYVKYEELDDAIQNLGLLVQQQENFRNTLISHVLRKKLTKKNKKQRLSRGKMRAMASQTVENVLNPARKKVQLQRISKYYFPSRPYVPSKEKKTFFFGGPKKQASVRSIIKGLAKREIQSSKSLSRKNISRKVKNVLQSKYLKNKTLKNLVNSMK